MNTSCPIEGNADLYGLGIRLSLYIQIMTTQLSGLTSTLLPIDDNIGHAVVIFILAVTTVLLRLLLSKTIQAVEVFPILSLLVVQLGACRVPFWKRPTTILLFVGEAVGLLALFAWFWFKGMDGLPRACVDDYAFFFAKVSIWHWFRKLNKALAVISIVFTTPFILFYVFAFFGLFAAHTHALFSRKSYIPSESVMPNASVEIAFDIGIIVYVEMALKWNKISGVHSLSSAGQFMPFFIALAQLFTTIYRLAKHFAIAEVNEELDEDEECDCECRSSGKNNSSAVVPLSPLNNGKNNSQANSAAV